jgi:hypothetical protein
MDTDGLTHSLMVWQEPEIWYDNLATFYAATGALITDPCGLLRSS